MLRGYYVVTETAMKTRHGEDRHIHKCRQHVNHAGSIRGSEMSHFLLAQQRTCSIFLSS